MQVLEWIGRHPILTVVLLAMLLQALHVTVMNHD